MMKYEICSGKLKKSKVQIKKQRDNHRDGKVNSYKPIELAVKMANSVKNKNGVEIRDENSQFGSETAGVKMKSLMVGVADEKWFYLRVAENQYWLRKVS